MFRRQLLEGFLQSFRELTTADFLERVSVRSWQSADFVVGVFTMKDHMAPFAAPEIDREICGDTVEPSRKAGARFEFCKVLEGANEGFLCELNRVILIVHHRECHPDHAALVTFHQDAERLGVALPGPLD